jgi:hypothetical protein
MPRMNDHERGPGSASIGPWLALAKGRCNSSLRTLIYAEQVSVSKSIQRRIFSRFISAEWKQRFEQKHNFLLGEDMLHRTSTLGS